MSRFATGQEELDALEDWRVQNTAHRQRLAAQARKERTEARLKAQGWSDWAVKQDAERGTITAYQDSQRPWGAPEHMTDRKSRKRKQSLKRHFIPWYQRGCDPTEG